MSSRPARSGSSPDDQRVDPSPLYGRDADIRLVLESTGTVTIIAGDPGAGKSTLLVAVQRVSGPLAPAPIETRNSPDSLARALAHSLAEAASLAADLETAAETIGAAVAGALDRLKRAAGVLGSSAVTTIFWSVVEARIGTQGSEVLRSAVQAAMADEETVREAIYAAIPPGVIDQLLELAADLRRSSRGHNVYLAIDRLERLTEDDTRRLIDLCASLPAGVTLRGCWSTDDSASVDRLERIEREGATVVRLQDLDATAVAQWVTAIDGPPDVVPELMRVSNGNPLAIDGALRHIAAGGRLDLLTPDRRITQIDRAAYAALSSSDQAAVASLAAFERPPGRHRVASYLKTDEAAWLALENRLQRFRILGAALDGRPWFHELRRRDIWSNVLTPAQRAHAATAALEELAAATAADGADAPVTLEAARLAPEADRLNATDPEFAFFSSCSPTHLAIVGALIELSEPSLPDLPFGPVSGEALLLHAREAFGAQGDLLAALRDMAANSTVVLAEQGSAAVAIRSWRSWPGTLVAVGRMVKELGRYPTQRAATYVFEGFLRPRLGEFTQGVYGIGHVDVDELLRTRRSIPDFDDSGMRVMRPTYETLLVEADYQSIPIYAMTAYRNPGATTSAALAEGPIEGPGGQVTTVNLLIRCPVPVVPSRRFLTAAERITGVSLGTAHSAPLGHRTPAPNLDLGQIIDAQAAVVEAIRPLCSRVELASMDLLRPLGFLYASSEKMSIVAEVVGRAGAVRVAMPSELHSPYTRFALASAAGLGPGQHVGLLTYRSYLTSGDDGPTALLTTLHKRAAMFNDKQERLLVPADRRALLTLLEEAERRVRSDALQLLPAFDFMEERAAAPLGRKSFVVLWLGQLGAFGPDDRLSGVVISVPSDEVPAVDLRLLPSKPEHFDFSEPEPFMLSEFGVTDLTGYSMTQSSGAALLAELLGHMVAELELPNPVGFLRAVGS